MNHHEPPGRIHGQVLDTAGSPVAKAYVRVWDDVAAVDLQTTNARGQFTSRLLFAGKYRVEAEHDGHRGAVDGVTVALNETTEVTVRLS